MAVRPIDFQSKALVKGYTVQAAGAATKGCGAIIGTAPEDALNAGANGKVFGIFLDTAAAAARVDVALSGVVPVLVGTGGATQGEFAIATADGFTNQTLGGGTTVKHIAGKFLQTGVAGDYVGLVIGCFAAGAA